jgi:hypothetical protein
MWYKETIMTDDLIKNLTAPELTKSLTTPLSTYPRPSFNLPLSTSLIPINNILGIPTFTRATTATVIDFEGILHTAKINESRFTGARRVENLIEFSEDFSQSDWTNNWGGGVTLTIDDTIAPNGTQTADKIAKFAGAGDGMNQGKVLIPETVYSASCYFKNVNSTVSRFIIWDDANSVVSGDLIFDWTEGVPSTQSSTGASDIKYEAVGDNWFRISYTFTTNALSTSHQFVLLPVVDSIYIWGAQLEQVSGTQTEASEYVSTGVLSDPWHGCGVDGVKYFNTDRSGVIISDSILKGYRTDKESTNIVLQSEDFGTTWSNQGVVVTVDSTIAPTGTLTADKIAQIDNKLDSIFQLIVLAADSTYIVSQYFKNVDSTQTRVRIHDNNAVATLAELYLDWTAGVPSTSSSSGASNIKYEALYDGWYRVSYHFTTAGTVTTHSYLDYPESSATATNSIYTWGAQIELGAFPTSYIKTTTTTVTRTPDELCYDNTNNQLLPNSCSMIMSTTPVADGEDYVVSEIRVYGSEDSRGTGNESRTAGNVSVDYLYSAANTAFILKEIDIDTDVVNKYGFQVFQNGADVDAKIFKDGISKLNQTETQILDHSNISFCLGFYGSDYYTGNIKDVNIYDTKLTDSQLKELTR